MEYHYRRPLPERRSAVAHWLHYTWATADRLFRRWPKATAGKAIGSGLRVPDPVSATAGKAIGGGLRIFRFNLCFFVKFRQIACQLGCAGILVYYISLAAVL